MTGVSPYASKRQPMPWAEHGACREVDTTVFFPERGEDTAPAKAICAECPVIAECLDYALATREVWGVWGGKSERERRRLRSLRRSQFGSSQHGTTIAVRLHNLAGEPLCDICRDARNERARATRFANRPKAAL